MERWEKERKEYHNSLTEVLLNNKSVQEYDLHECINIERVVIGPDVENIETGSFLRCSKLKEVVIAPENNNFYMDGGCLIEKESKKLILCLGAPRIPEYIETVYTDVFNSPLSEDKLFIHKSVKKIVAFNKFCSFKDIEIESGNEYYEVDGGCVYERGGSTIVLGCEHSVIGSRAETVGSYAFSGIRFKLFEIPSNIELIEDNAFSNCFNLEEIIFNEGLKEIGEFVFSNNTALQSIALPQTLIKMGKGAFWECPSLERIDSFGGLVEINNRCFHNCGMKTLSLGGNIKKICDEAFCFSNKLEEFVACDGLEAIGKDAFQCCKNLKKISLADTVKEIGEGVFCVCESLTDVKLSKSLKVIPVNAFYECKSLTEIELPDGLQKIDSWAFYNCSKLQRTNAAELKSIKKIYSDAFTGCRKLKKEAVGKKPPKLPKQFYSFDSFDEIMQTAKKGTSYEFMSMSLGSFVAKLEGVTELDGVKYLCLRKKDLEFFAEISSELVKDEIVEDYDVYLCTVVENQDLAIKIKAAAKADN